MVLYKIYRFYYFLHHSICFALFYCGFFVLLYYYSLICISLICLCAFVTLNKRLLTYLLTYLGMMSQVFLNLPDTRNNIPEERPNNENGKKD